MFKKKKCPKCGKKIDEKYSFCPYCGYKTYSEEDDEDWGMLGKNDSFPLANEIKLPVGFNTIFNSLMKNLSKEFDEQLSRNYFPKSDKSKKTKKDGISISISTFGNGSPKIKVTQLGDKTQQKIKETEKIKTNTFTKEKIKQFTDLPREEPLTNIRRLSNKVVYEIEMPGVKSIKDISIIKLENSIEIKAVSKDKAYAKIIPINLPIKNYNLSDGKLILELGIKN
jgi:HSP20 family molecular chaperone IbpA